MKLSVVILNWNRYKDTKECLESISKVAVEGFDLEIVVVDNGSTDGSQEKILKILGSINKKRGFVCELIKLDENKGFSAGNNCGIKHALSTGSDYILILNNDTEVEKNLFVKLLNFFEKNKKIAVASPKIYFAKGFEYDKKRYKKKDLGKVIWYAGGEIDWDNIYGKNRGVDMVDRNIFKKTEPTDFATGACMMIRSSVLRKLKGFDEMYYMYLEDVDFCVRARKKGWGVYYYPKTYIYHKVAQSSGIGSDLNDYFITRNRLIFGYRYGRLRTKYSLFKESLRLLFNGRKWQKIGALDYYINKFGKGSWGKKAK